MATLLRLYTFTPNTTISSTQVNAEFDQIINTLRGANTTDVYIGSSTPPSGGTPKFMVNGQAYFVLNGSGTTIALYREGDAAASPRMSISNLGNIRMVASQNAVTPSAQTMVLDGVLYCFHETVAGGAVGNVGSGEDDLLNFDIIENVLGFQTQYLHVFGGGVTAANANNKRIRFYVKTTAVLDSGTVAFNNMPWFVDVKIFSHTGQSAVTVIGEFRCDTTIVRCCTTVTAFDHTASNAMKFTAVGVADNDVRQLAMLVRKGMSA